MKSLFVLVIIVAAGYFAYGKFVGRDNPEVIDHPVYADMRVDVAVEGRELGVAMFAKMASDDDCRLRANLVWQKAFAGCQGCKVQPPDCKAQLPARYARLFDDVPIPSTYLAFTRGTRFERDGRLVIYGLTNQEGAVICEQLRGQLSQSYSGAIRCIAASGQ